MSGMPRKGVAMTPGGGSGGGAGGCVAGRGPGAGEGSMACEMLAGAGRDNRSGLESSSRLAPRSNEASREAWEAIPARTRALYVCMLCCMFVSCMVRWCFGALVVVVAVVVCVCARASTRASRCMQALVNTFVCVLKGVLKFVCAHERIRGGSSGRKACTGACAVTAHHTWGQTQSCCEASTGTAARQVQLCCQKTSAFAGLP